jgi:hypothetical protein
MAIKDDKVLGEDLSSYYAGTEPQEHATRTATEEVNREKYDELVRKNVEKLRTASNQEIGRVLNQLTNDKDTRIQVGDGLIHKLEAEIVREIEKARRPKKP